ncbi:MAG: hypothetical protein JXO72_15480 [Vicinamibacteria bacterium]|nr:hypothetical protein [Vicinamibacteria bacterium]
MNGVIIGGWEYVLGAYGLTAGMLAIYGMSVVRRYRLEIERRRPARGAAR